MATEKILNKKIEQLNILKISLVSRSDEKKSDIVDKIKETIEELTLILEDFNYIK